MKMVAAAKLKRAQEAAEASRPYAERLEKVVSSIASKVTVGPQSPKLLAERARTMSTCSLSPPATRGWLVRSTPTSSASPASALTS
jgi:F0F1-type ATP synthase gamma subunit